MPEIRREPPSPLAVCSPDEPESHTGSGFCFSVTGLAINQRNQHSYSTLFLSLNLKA